MPAVAQDETVRLTPKGARSRQRILDTGERLFAEKGYAGTTLRDVAAASGLRIPSLYNHFTGKEALYSAVLERGMQPLLEAIEKEAAERGLSRAGAIRKLLIEALTHTPNGAPLMPERRQHALSRSRQSD